MNNILIMGVKSFIINRRKRRNLTFVMAISFLLIFFFLTLFSKLLTNIDSYWGDLLIGNGSVIMKANERYELFTPPKAGDFFDASLVKSAENNKKLITAGRIRTHAMLENFDKGNTSGVMLIGSDMDNELKINKGMYLVEGRLPVKGTHEIMFYSSIQGNQDIKVGEKVIIYLRTVDGYDNYDTAVVTGILHHRNIPYFYGSNLLAYIPIEFMRELKGIGEGMVSEIVFSGNPLTIKKYLPDKLKIADFHKSVDILGSMRFLYLFFAILLFGIILVVVISSVYNNMTLLCMEREKEIGVYMTFGADKKFIAMTWCIDLALYTFYISIIGGTAGAVFIFAVNSAGIYAINEVFSIILGANQLKLNYNAGLYLLSYLIMFVSVLFSAMKPILFSANESGIVKLFKR